MKKRQCSVGWEYNFLSLCRLFLLKRILNGLLYSGSHCPSSSECPCPCLLRGQVSRHSGPQDIVAKSNFTLVLTPTSPLTLLTFPTNMEFCRSKIRTWSTNVKSLEILEFFESNSPSLLVSHFLYPSPRTT